MFKHLKDINDVSGLPGTKGELRMFITIITCVVLAIVGIGSYLITGQPDGPVEELSEYIIKEETGLDIDLTPNSPEENK